VQTVSLFSPICSFIHARQTKASQEKRKETSPILLFHVPLYTPVDDRSLNNNMLDDFVDRFYPIELE
jgi:hypothetical protein